MLSGEVFTKLKHDIIQNRFKPEQKLRLSDLKNLYHTGTSPIREALFQLSHVGFANLENQKGFRVAPMSAADCADLCTCLSDLQRPLLLQVIHRGNDAWEANVAAKTFLLKKRISQTSPSSWDCLVDLHHYYQQLWTPSTSQYRKQQHLKWFELLCRYLYLGGYKAGFMTQLLQKHCDLSEFIHQRDAQNACALSDEIYQYSAEVMQLLAA